MARRMESTRAKVQFSDRQAAMALSISTWCAGTPITMAEKKSASGWVAEFLEAVGDEFIGHFLGADAGQFHLVERLHGGQARGAARQPCS